MINSDPKGELYQYTYPFLQRLGYYNYPLDFKNPKVSIHYNFLQFIINAVEEGDMSKAISASWDFVDSIVHDSKNLDPLWANGEKGLLAAATMQVVFDNSKKGLYLQYPEASESEIAGLYETKHKFYQNCTNLFHYISKMTIVNEATKNLLLQDIIDVLPNSHPSKMTMAIAESAPPKTRGSFITSALATLRLFTDPNIADMTSCTDEGLLDMAAKKAIFIILPDSKQTYYPLASMFVNQYYQYLSDTADELGGRLDRDFEFNLDEFGNFTKIPFFDGKMTVGAGRGIHFHLYVQSKEQLTLKYDKELANIILDNCHHWLYLKSNGPETLDLIEKRLGKYTVLSTSASASMNDSGMLSVNSSGSTSTSTQLISRALLAADEIAKIARPYLLVISDNGYPSLTQIPDISQWNFNMMFGLDSKEHNTKLRLYRENARVEHDITPINLWDFIPYINHLVKEKLVLAEVNNDINDAFLKEIASNFIN